MKNILSSTALCISVIFTAIMPMQANAQLKSSETLVIKDVNDHAKHIEFTSFDGSKVVGRILLPDTAQASYPVMLSFHGMMRSHNRAWMEEYKKRPTIESTHLVTQAATNAGYAVIALDARYHGARKVKDKPVDAILKALRQGEPALYVDMISSTVKDYQHLLALLKSEQKFNTKNLSVTGYSMGAQMAMLVAAQLPEVSNVIAMVPPHIEEDLPHVSPEKQASNIENARVLLFTSTQDQYSTNEQNQVLFANIAAKDKTRVTLEADHLLPASYVDFIPNWLARAQ